VKRDSSPKRALERLNNYKPDCIVVDCELKEMTGLEFVNAIKSNPTLFDIPIVVLTSSVNLDEIIGLLHVGVDDYLHKSMEPEIFMAKIKSFLRLSKLQNEMRKLN
jgi:DNA-binding response OmpR family regulator